MEIIEINQTQLDQYARIPISFEVHTVFEVVLTRNGLGGICFTERPVASGHYLKDYDQFGSPLSWAVEFDIQNWGIFMAMDGGLAVGGATVAWNTAGNDMLEGRRDLSVLWDIRVLPVMRGHGIGKLLFEYAAAWSRSRDCEEMKIETQNINVAACRFYSAMGAELGDIRRFAYHSQALIAHEVQLNWYLRL